eukprot:SAG31_NODE_1289_length_8983_cov_9.783543_8_plen_160_part_00
MRAALQLLQGRPASRCAFSAPLLARRSFATLTAQPTAALSSRELTSDEVQFFHAAGRQHAENRNRTAAAAGTAAVAAAATILLLSTDLLTRQAQLVGYVIVKKLFSAEEAALLLEAGRKDKILAQQAFDQKDQDGKSSKLVNSEIDDCTCSSMVETTHI